MPAPTEDEHDSKERFLRKQFLQEWKIVKSLLDDIVSNQQLSDLSSVHKTRFIAMYGYSSPNTEMALPETAAHVNKNS
ncbi:hypothetical protein BDE02_02G133700 [Populus trichocarpa]|nr:hypothetical protein BDE02_02G133700 [Populus trichocarpa]